MPTRLRHRGLGFRLKRESLGLTQQDVADRAGKSKSAISRFENGESLPSEGAVEHLAHAIGSSLEEIDHIARSAAAAMRAMPPPDAHVEPQELERLIHAVVTTLKHSHPDTLAHVADALRGYQAALIRRETNNDGRPLLVVK